MNRVKCYFLRRNHTAKSDPEPAELRQVCELIETIRPVCWPCIESQFPHVSEGQSPSRTLICHVPLTSCTSWTELVQLLAPCRPTIHTHGSILLASPELDVWPPLLAHFRLSHHHVHTHHRDAAATLAKAWTGEHQRLLQTQSQPTVHYQVLSTRPSAEEQWSCSLLECS